jgi:hypothetical protein
MLTQTHWKESFDYRAWDPTQHARTHYTGLPGGYSTFYYDQIPNTTTLVGPQLPQTMNPNETVSLVPPVFGQADTGYSAGRVAIYAVLAAALGAGLGYAASRVL